MAGNLRGAGRALRRDPLLIRESDVASARAAGGFSRRRHPRGRARAADGFRSVVCEQLFFRHHAAGWQPECHLRREQLSHATRTLPARVLRDSVLPRHFPGDRNRMDSTDYIDNEAEYAVLSHLPVAAASRPHAGAMSATRIVWNSPNAVVPSSARLRSKLRSRAGFSRRPANAGPRWRMNRPIPSGNNWAPSKVATFFPALTWIGLPPETSGRSRRSRTGVRNAEEAARIIIQPSASATFPLAMPVNGGP